VLIGLAFRRRGRQPNLEEVIHDTGKRIAACARLDPYLKNEVRSIPAEPDHQRGR
jgi:hypothetical protein